MRKRHARETADLVARQYGERASTLRRALEGVFDAKRDEKVRVVDGLAAAGASQGEVDAALAVLDLRYEEAAAAAQKAALEELDVRHAGEQVGLRQRQLAEISDAYRELAPQEVLLRAEADAAAAQAAELASFQADMEKQRAARVAAIAAQKAAVEEELRRANEAEMARLEQEHAAAVAEETRRSDEQLRVRRERLMKEQQEQQRRRLEEAGALDVEAKERIMREFEEDTARTEAKLELVRAGQAAKLEAKLAERKAKKAAKAAKELADRMAVQAADSARQVAEEAEAAKAAVAAHAAAAAQANAAAAAAPAALAAKMTANINAAAAAATSASGPASVAGGGAVDAAARRASKAATEASGRAATAVHPATAAAAAVNVQPRSAGAADERRGALLARVGNLETMLQALVTQAQQQQQVSAGSGTAVVPATAPAPAASSLKPMIAPAAASAVAALGPAQARSTAAAAGQPRPGDGVLRPVEPSQLSARQALRLDFARRVVAALHTQAVPAAGGASRKGDEPSARGPPALAAASAFPSPAPASQRFFDAFFYEPSSHTLYVRTGELEAAGDLTMSLAHALAALSVPACDLSPSAVAAPDVLLQLNKNLTALAAEFFKQHASSGSSNAPGSSAAAAPAGPADAASPAPLMRAPSLRRMARGSSRHLLTGSVSGSPSPLLRSPSTTSGDAGSSGDAYFASSSLEQRLRRYNSALRVLGQGGGAAGAAGALATGTTPSKQ
jgi:hypothetical protein